MAVTERDYIKEHTILSNKNTDQVII